MCSFFLNCLLAVIRRDSVISKKEFAQIYFRLILVPPLTSEFRIYTVGSMYLKSFMCIQYVDRSYTNMVRLKRAMKSKKFFQFCCPWLLRNSGARNKCFTSTEEGTRKWYTL